MANKPLKMTDDGKMLSGVIVRHLVMPMCGKDTRAILKWFKEELPPTVYLSLMSQYTPYGNIQNFPELNRAITAREYQTALDTAESLGITRLFAQERSSSSEKFIPSWDF
jgi:putative pyruvate formate lyase activating enzyme